MEQENNVQAALPARTYKLSLLQLLDEAWELAKSKIWRLLGIDLIMLASMLGAMIAVSIPAAILVGISLLIKIPALTVFIFALSLLAIIIAILAVTLWSFIASLNVIHSEEYITVRQALLNALPKIKPLMPTYLLALLAMFAGSIFFIIPGIIVFVSLYLVLYVAVIENLTTWQAFKRSRDLIRGRWWNMFGVLVFAMLIILFVMMMTGFETSPITIIITPFSYLLGYIAYKQLSANPTNPTPRGDWYYKLLAVVAGIAIIASIVGFSIGAGTDWESFQEKVDQSMSDSGDGESSEEDYESNEEWEGQMTTPLESEIILN